MLIGSGVIGYAAALVSLVILLLARARLIPEMDWEEAFAIGTAIVGGVVVFLAKVRPLIKAGKASPQAITKALLETAEGVEALRKGDMSLRDAEDLLLSSVQETRRARVETPMYTEPAPRSIEPTPELLTRLATMKSLGRRNVEIAHTLGMGSWEVERLIETPGYQAVLKAASRHVAHRDD
ncbi:MAG: hypothetical protein HN396_04540 [Gemmatimonadales bacterium]|jgi:hypothetical protein|nr:hypothetical protein [Gemmatimonadales bacterium]